MDLYCVLVKQSRIFSPEHISSASQYNQSSILFEPPKKLNLMYYRCDSKFCVNSILEMYDGEENYGICLISGEELKIYIASVSGQRIDIKIIDKETIELETRTRRGGSSSGRYGRINDKAKNFNKTSFVEMIVDAYMIDNHTKCKIKKLILAGPTDMKKEISETPLFQQHLFKYLFKFVNTNGIHETTAHDVMNQIISDIKYADVKTVDDEIEKLIQTDYDMLTIGRIECEEYIKSTNIKKLYICKSLLLGDQETLKMLDLLKEEIKGIIIIFSESTTLKTYGGWVGVKKYINFIDY